MLRPFENKKKEGANQELWKGAERDKTIERTEEVSLFKLTREEFEKCRFSLPDKNTREVECQVHTKGFSHGYRLHPPHLWDLREQIIYRKNNKGEFERWYPEFKSNLRLDK